MTTTFDDHVDALRYCVLVVRLGRGPKPTAAQMRAAGLGHLVNSPREVAHVPNYPRDIATMDDVCAAAQALRVLPRASLTVEQLCIRYLGQLYTQRKRPGDSTLRTYVTVLRNHIMGTELGALHAVDVGAEHVDAWQADRLATPCLTKANTSGATLSEATVQKVRSGVLGPAFKWARRKNGDEPPMRLDHPMEGASPLEVEASDVDIIEDPEMAVEILRLAADPVSGGHPSFAKFVAFQMRTGMRWAECAPVRGCDLIHTGRYYGVLISRRIVRGKIVDGAKSNAGKRIPPLSDAYYAACKADTARDPQALMLVNRYGRQWVHSTLTNHWERITAAYNAAHPDEPERKFRSHSIRHSLATELSNSGVDPVQIEKALGHKPPRPGELAKVRGRYTQLSRSGARHMAAVADALVGAAV